MVALHRRVNYPEVDMHYLNDLGQQYDLVVHSDTLEHVDNPVHTPPIQKHLIQEWTSCYLQLFWSANSR